MIALAEGHGEAMVAIRISHRGRGGYSAPWKRPGGPGTSTYLAEALGRSEEAFASYGNRRSGQSWDDGELVESLVRIDESADCVKRVATAAIRK